MDKTSPDYRQVALLVRALPWVANESCFALKGGTAINLFIHDFPRLSVDIDLAWIPLESREVALPNVREALTRIAAELEAQTGIRAVLQTHNPDEMRIIVTTDDAQIKIEVSPVARGTLYPPQERDIVGAVEEEFGFAALPVVSLPDLYGGKLCAALDRQHPRDFYDVKMLLDTQGIDRSIFNGFIVYLLSHNRPLSEVLNPRWKDITEPFQNEFSGMTFEEVSLEELKEVPERMLSTLKTHFTQQDFDFLMSFKRGEPDWNLAPEPHIQNLPAVQWKLRNIGQMSEEKRAQSLEKLEKVMTEWLR
ncbi:nucleotidyl transferase AbiEii/AbiGii toxin family protein [Escherichia coli]|uniref:nucleotidyl transferase AbiEii/AbiGii toxin family protein n=1 Tax=Escherichia coli TaxID=562 RepID=UPI0006A13419|nr:nucleotidyl transferase AbiEii/AbiGii toxin family protein [Escherichia coli]EFC7225323.1 nucleotidyl transferase AbiEii/AbiGii toxin family protein [Escherichia coli]EFG1575089.1 nucleotidyl transferase AbiEii/AbiGii toxin family protein [Escherichia coli]EHX8356248.1 nucleotidyl transferase AbiEii/AbiGii toxin family protein [Escherichia coli]EJD0140055.1 nucleotidyl transferase AbiEii/AbiGii toxin family protein [Escherichia coli]EKH1497683.1 nucleotidyl transferase AbiEii/AbiGii toxin f